VLIARVLIARVLIARVLIARVPIAHGGPQRFLTRASPSLMTALRDARGSPPWTPWTILCRLTGTTGFFQSVLVATAQIAATLADSVGCAHCRSAIPNALSRPLGRTSLPSVR
jgi:hypothetical protein